MNYWMNRKRDKRSVTYRTSFGHTFIMNDQFYELKDLPNFSNATSVEINLKKRTNERQTGFNAVVFKNFEV